MKKCEQNSSILVVDDDSDTRYALTKILGKCGCTVTQAYTVEEALQLMDSSRFDVVFSDMRFNSELGGEELLESVLNKHRSTDVVLMSCSMDITRKQYLMEKGASACLEKPFFRSTCEDTLLAISNQQQQRAA